MKTLELSWLGGGKLATHPAVDLRCGTPVKRLARLSPLFFFFSNATISGVDKKNKKTCTFGQRSKTKRAPPRIATSRRLDPCLPLTLSVWQPRSKPSSRFLSCLRWSSASVPQGHRNAVPPNRESRPGRLMHSSTGELPLVMHSGNAGH